MPTNKQRRDAARRRLERQLERREQRSEVHKRRAMIATVVGCLILLVAIGIVVGVVVSSSSKSKPTAAATTSAAASTGAATSSPAASSSAAAPAGVTTGPCGYTVATAANGEKIKNTGLPPDPKPTPTKTLTVDFATNRGAVQVQLDGKAAPCIVQGLSFLINKKYYDNTTCHRLVSSGIFVIQCGDPFGDGSGNPSFTMKDENLTAAKYTTGMVAMANSGPNTNGSQFFFITKDSTSLPKSYTVVGKVTSGMDVLQKVAAGGSDNANGTGDGHPKLPLTFKTVKIAAVAGGGATPGVGPSPTLITPKATAVTPKTTAPASPTATAPSAPAS
jgi:peptidyl-prolyl cis-trans isomerase B (cyclophilin B)